MRAARLHGFKDLRIEDIAEPTCSPGTVKIRPQFNGLCGSDLHGFFVKDFKQIFLPGPHPLTGETPPVTFGHEFSGVVIQVGDGVEDFTTGDHVVVMPLVADNTCDACNRGAPNCCRQLGFIGVHGFGGGLSDAVVVKRDLVFKLPSTVGFDIGALVEPLAVGWHGVRMVENVITPKITALVIGGGPIGCAAILALVARGVETIMVSEINQARADITQQLGATHILDSSAGSVVDQVMAITETHGVDIVFDCAGVNATLDISISAVRAHGQIVNLAVWSGEASFDPNTMVAKEASWRASLAYTSTDFEQVIEALAKGNMNPQKMITKRIPLEKIIEEGLEPLHEGVGNHCKILVDLNL